MWPWSRGGGRLSLVLSRGIVLRFLLVTLCIRLACWASLRLLELQFPASFAEGTELLEPDELSTVSPKAFLDPLLFGLFGLVLAGKQDFCRNDPFFALDPGLLGRDCPLPFKGCDLAKIRGWSGSGAFRACRSSLGLWACRRGACGA